MLAVLERSPGPSPAPEPVQAEQPGDRIGHYELREIIGEGAFGVVWRAEQHSPVRREVALKIIKLGMDTRAVVARFEAERQALALMDHPNIAQVFDGGATRSGRPYFVMELVRGMPITAFCDAERLRVGERLDLFITVCEAVQHAHQKGIIHRDLKPSNVMVTARDGTATVKVIDFGIAKATEQRLTEETLVTQFNQFMGTPAYMSPEQAGWGGLDIDTRSDVYSLGVLLYELVTSQTPFDAKELVQAGLQAIQKTIRETDPPKPSTRLSTLGQAKLTEIARLRGEPPETLGRKLRGDLDWIILKALEKDRARRYQSPSGLALDLRNYLGDHPVTAAPPTWRYQALKFARRHRAALATGFAFAAVLLGATVISVREAVRARTNLAQARLNAYASDINLAQQALAENNQSRALELLDRHRPRPGEKDDLRAFEWRYLWQQARPNELATFSDWGESLAFSPDGKLLAIANNQLVIREMSSHRVVTNLNAGGNSVCFSPDGKLIAVAGHQRLVLWNTATWERLPQTLPGARFPVRFSPNGSWLLTGSKSERDEEKYVLWATDSWKRVAFCPGASDGLIWQLRNAVAFSPDSTLLVTPWLDSAAQICGLKLWRLPGLEPVYDIFPPELSSWSTAFHPDGKHLLIGTFYGELMVWDLAARKITQSFKENKSGINTISVAAGAKVFATAAHDHRVTLWDTETFKVLARFRGHTQSVWASALTPDGSIIATGSFDGATKLWDGTTRESASFADQSSLIAGFTQNSRTLVLAPLVNDNRWHLIGAEHKSIEVPADPPLRWNFIYRPYDVLKDVPLAVLGRTDGSVELWDLAKAQKTATWQASENEVTAASFSPDGTRLVTGDSTGQVRLWELATHHPIADFALPPGNPVCRATISPNGRMLAAGSWPSSKDVFLWDLDTGKLIHHLAGPANSVTTIAFSPDGKLLAAGGMGPSQIFVWDLPSGRRHNPLQGHVTGIVEVSFSPDGKTLATGGYDTIKLWNIATEQEIASLPFRGTFRSLCFSPDGTALAAGYITYPGHQVRIYRAPSLTEITETERLADRDPEAR